MVRPATEADLEFLVQHDRHLTRPAMMAKIQRQEVVLLEREGLPIGWARYNLFCDLIPFLTNIHVLEGCRRQGFGTRLIEHWEQEMRRLGFAVVLTSTQADEDAQFFYRKLGYRDSGGLLLPGQAATEIVMLKALRRVDSVGSAFPPNA